jgi:hypothetical protein
MTYIKDARKKLLQQIETQVREVLLTREARNDEQWYAGCSFVVGGRVCLIGIESIAFTDAQSAELALEALPGRFKQGSDASVSAKDEDVTYLFYGRASEIINMGQIPDPAGTTADLDGAKAGISG